MSLLELFHPPSVYLEFGHSSLKVLSGGRAMEFPVERLENGRLTNPCRNRLRQDLQSFFKHKDWQARLPAVCAIGARGVSLRQLTLPAAPKKELPKLLHLQIESEFPLPPEQLAWGYRSLNHVGVLGNGKPAQQELIVAAVKKDVVEEYSEILSTCGLDTVFTLASLARDCLCPQPPGFYAVLDIGRIQSELISVENGVPSALRVVPWGGERLTQAISKRLGIDRSEAEKLKLQAAQEKGADGEIGKQLQAALQEEIEVLAGSLHSNWIGQKLYLAGRSSRFQDLPLWLCQAFGGGIPCERLDTPVGAGDSAALLGLKQSWGQPAEIAPLTLQIRRADGVESIRQPAHWKWAALAVLLALCSFSLRYAEAFVQKPRLTRKLTELRSFRDRLPAIDRELNFLDYLRTNQPPYLEALLTLAKSAPRGTHIDSISLNRRGEISFKGSLQNAEQAVEFRNKLVASGFFSFVGVDDQTPTPDRQKLNVRMTAQWKPASEREALAKEKPKTQSKSPGQPESAPPTNAPAALPPGVRSGAPNPPSDSSPKAALGPEGTSDNSTTYQRWVPAPKHEPVPKGRLAVQWASAVPSGRNLFPHRIPNVKMLGYSQTSLRDEPGAPAFLPACAFSLGPAKMPRKT